MFTDAPIIDIVTRQDLIDDGELIVISEEITKDAGIKYPTAVTTAVYALLEDAPRHEDFKGRAFDMVNMFRLAVKGHITSRIRSTGTGQEMLYVFILNDSSWSGGDAKEVAIKAVVGPGDNLEPVLTFMLPDED